MYCKHFIDIHIHVKNTTLQKIVQKDQLLPATFAKGGSREDSEARISLQKP
jgi:hypothetical protein